jgi:hypothetical protein
MSVILILSQKRLVFEHRIHSLKLVPCKKGKEGENDDHYIHVEYIDGTKEDIMDVTDSKAIWHIYMANINSKIQLLNSMAQKTSGLVRPN